MRLDEDYADAIPAPYALADWRRRINDLYAEVRAMTDPAEAHAHWLKVRSGLFRRHPMSPLSPMARRAFERIDAFAYDPNLRFAVALRPVTGQMVQFDLGEDGIMQARRVARTDGLAEALGAELAVWWIGGYGGGLFIPFRDATAGRQSYGGGRYVVDAIKGSDLGLDPSGRLILDFNFAYNPSCAFSTRFVCPLAPAQNLLPAPVRAGERSPPPAAD